MPGNKVEEWIQGRLEPQRRILNPKYNVHWVYSPAALSPSVSCLQHTCIYGMDATRAHGTGEPRSLSLEHGYKSSFKKHPKLRVQLREGPLGTETATPEQSRSEGLY